MIESLDDREKIDPQEEMINNLSVFMTERNINGTDLRAAYLMALDLSVSEIGHDDIRKEVEDLAKEIKSQFDKGLALNRVVELVSSKENYDNATDNYLSLVEKMILTEKEKKILSSIIENERSGQLVVSSSQGNRKIDEFEIPEKEDEKISKQDLAIKLIEFLSKFKDSKGLFIEFSS